MGIRAGAFPEAAVDHSPPSIRTFSRRGVHFIKPGANLALLSRASAQTVAVLTSVVPLLLYNPEWDRGVSTASHSVPIT